MLEDPVADRLWHHLHEELAPVPAAAARARRRASWRRATAPRWPGMAPTPGCPPAGTTSSSGPWRTCSPGRPLDTLGALQIVVGAAAAGERALDADGGGVPGARAAARVPGAHRVRPADLEGALSTDAHRARTRRGRRDDGQPFDPWIRVHARLGGRIATPSPASDAHRGQRRRLGDAGPAWRSRTPARTSCRAPPRRSPSIARRTGASTSIPTSGWSTTSHD